jgi:hypothetical protein
VVRYADLRKLNRDRKNQRFYLAAAAGYTLARIPDEGEIVSLKPAFDSSPAVPDDIFVRKIPTTAKEKPFLTGE